MGLSNNRTLQNLAACHGSSRNWSTRDAYWKPSRNGLLCKRGCRWYPSILHYLRIVAWNMPPKEMEAQKMPRYLLPSSWLFRGQPWKGLAIEMKRHPLSTKCPLNTLSMKHLQFCQKWILDKPYFYSFYFIIHAISVVQRFWWLCALTLRIHNTESVEC